MSKRHKIKKIVEDYNRFGGHCPECDDFLFTKALTYNPPKVIQYCLGCDFERDISEKVKKSIGFEDKFSKYEVDSKLLVNNSMEEVVEKQFDEIFERKKAYHDLYAQLGTKSTGMLYRSASGVIEDRDRISHHLSGKRCTNCGCLLKKSDIIIKIERDYNHRCYFATIVCPACKTEFFLDDLER